MPFSDTQTQDFQHWLFNHHIPVDNQWTNFSQNLHPAPVLRVAVKTLDELKTLVKKIYEMNKDKPENQLVSLKAAAGGPHWRLEQSDQRYRESFSRSQTAVADVIVNLVGPEFEKVGYNLKKLSASVGPNIQVKEFIEALYKKGLVPDTSTLMPYVTWIGATMINGINTGYLPSLSDLTLAMRIINFKGEEEWLDASNEEDFQKIKQCQLGLYGIVVELQVRCVPATKMRCVDQPLNRHQLLEAIDKGLFKGPKEERVSVFCVPDYIDHPNDPKAEPSILVKTWTPVSLNEKVTLKAKAEIVQNKWTEKIAINGMEDVSFDEIEAKHSKVVPIFTRGIIADQIGKDRVVTVMDRPDSVFYIYDYPKEFCNTDMLFRDTLAEKTEQADEKAPLMEDKSNGESITGNQQLRRVPLDGKKLQRVLKFMWDKLDEYKAKGKYPLGFGYYIRSICHPVNGTESSLAPTHHLEGEIIYSLDLVSNPKIDGCVEYIDEVVKYLTGPEYNALPHWGKDIQDFLDIPLMYGLRFVNAISDAVKFYAKRGGDFFKSMFLTASYRQLFKLNELDRGLFATDLAEIQVSIPEEKVADKGEKLSAKSGVLSQLWSKAESKVKQGDEMTYINLVEEDNEATQGICFPLCCGS